MTAMTVPGCLLGSGAWNSALCTLGSNFSPRGEYFSTPLCLKVWSSSKKQELDEDQIFRGSGQHQSQPGNTPKMADAMLHDRAHCTATCYASLKVSLILGETRRSI